MPPKIPLRFFWLADFAVLGAAFFTAYALTPRLQPLFTPSGPPWMRWLEALVPHAVIGGRLPPPGSLLWILLTMAPPTLLALTVLGNHGSLLGMPATRLLVGSLAAPLIGLGLVTLVLFALKSLEWSRLFIFLFALVSGVGLGLYRLGLRRYFSARRAAGYYAKHVVLVGLPGSFAWMARYFSVNVPVTDYCLVGALHVTSNQASVDSARDGRSATADGDVAVLGHVRDLSDLLIHWPIHEVIAILPASGGDWLPQVIQDCDYFGVVLRIAPEALLTGIMKDLQILYHAEPLRLPAVMLVPPHWDSEAVFFKRLLDIAVSATLLFVLMPLFVTIVVAIKIMTPQLPVFYRWRVVGMKGIPFTGYKFTTMVADADARKAELLPKNEMSGPVFKIKNDPRITRLGRFLRKYSLNEFPQLWSVLKGDMSLVGPRPAGPQELHGYELWHKRKLSIRPGITCLWQVRGRNRISNFDDWVRMDLEYIDNWSLWLDLKIMFRTVWVVLAGTGS